MEIHEHIAVIEEEGRLFADAAEHGGLDVTIPWCPGWDMRALVRHLGEIHLWAAAHVARRATRMWPEDLEELAVSWPGLAVFWPDDDDLVDFYRATNANLVRELRAAPADVAAMTFLPAPSPLSMWARRQAHEVTVHRIDAQQGADAVSGIDAAVAADGIDELLMCFAPREEALPFDTERSMLVSTTDTGEHWRVTMGPDGIRSVPEHGPADVTLSGRAEDLYLAVWNRGDRADIDVRGNREVLTAWHGSHRVVWS